MSDLMISIVVPVYNASATIEMCVESIRNQTYKQFEVILVNDGSKDDSGEKCKKYAEEDSRFHYVEKTNGGLSDARNAGLQHVRGAYVMFLDSDDALSPYALEYLADIIAKSQADIVSFNFTFDYEKIMEQPQQRYEEQRLIKEDILRRYFMKEVAVTNRIFKAALLDGLAFVKGQISEDVPYLFRCYQRASSLYVSDYVFYFYNQSAGGSITRSGLSIADQTAVQACLYVWENCKEELEEYQFLAEVQYLRALFNMVNKSVLRGFWDEQAKAYYKPILPQYRKQLRKNLKKICNAPSISKSDKLQIIVLSISFSLFKGLKKFYLKCR